MNEYYMTVAEIAERFNITTNAVYYWIDNGLPYKLKRIVGKGTVKVISNLELDKYLNIGVLEEPETKKDK